MTVLLIALSVLGAGLAAFWYYGSKPARHRNLTPERVTTLVEMLLERGRNGAALFVEERGGPRFVQLAKYVGESNHWGIQCDFPLAKWSEAFYARVPECVTELDLRAREMTTGRQDIQRFLTVDFGRNVKQAAQLITCVVERVFGLELARDCEAYLVNVSVQRPGAASQAGGRA